MSAKAASDSPLARLRASYEERQRAPEARYVEVWDDGALSARIRRTSDVSQARGIMRTAAALVADEDRLALTADDLADVIEKATDSLHTVNDGEYEPVLDEDGNPLSFDARFGAVIGVPKITTPRGAVFAAFSSPAVEGGPAELDTLRLMACATQIAFLLAGGGSRADAEESLKASAPKR